MNCPSCAILNINGVRCHERGCPDAWKDYTKECRECGCDFQPETRHQVYCDAACVASAYGLEIVDGDEA